MQGSMDTVLAYTSNMTVVMPFMGLAGLLPVLAHCQLFGAPSIPFPSYGPSPLAGLFSVLGFGGFPPMPRSQPFPSMYRSDPYYPHPLLNYRGPPPLDFPYPPMYVPPQNNIVLPKLPAKYDSGIYKSAPIYEKPGYPSNYEKPSYPPYKYEYPYPEGYSTKYEKAQYKSIYPKSALNGQPYGSYREFLRAILNGPSNSYLPSYSHSAPSVKSVLGNDYSSLTGKSPTIIYEKPDGPSYPPEPKVTYPVVFEEKQVYPEVKEAYARQQPEIVQYQRPSFSMPSTEFLKATLSQAFPHGLPVSINSQELPPNYQEKAYAVQEGKGIYQFPQYVEKKQTTYEAPGISINLPYQPERPRGGLGSGYDVLPVFNNVGLKPNPAYAQNQQSQAQNAQSPPPGYDLTYETDTPSYPQQQKMANVPTYFTAERQGEYKRDPALEKKAAPPADESYSPIKYPSLGYDVERDQRKPVPAIIAALFGGGKFGKNANDGGILGEQYGKNSQKMHQEMSNKQAFYGQASSFEPSSYLKDQRDQQREQAAQSGNSKYAQAQQGQNSPMDIFIPIGRTSKHTDPTKTIVH